jgi:hypothetical protein
LKGKKIDPDVMSDPKSHAVTHKRSVDQKYFFADFFAFAKNTDLKVALFLCATSTHPTLHLFKIFNLTLFFTLFIKNTEKSFDYPIS